MSESKHDYKVTCVISEREYIDVCHDYGFNYVYAFNNPLGAKINIGIKETLKTSYDYLMIMNSDNVVKSELIDTWYKFDEPFFGVNRVTYVNFETKDAVDFTYDFSVLGVAKMIRRDFAEHANLYRPDLNRCLDDTMMDRMIKFGAFPKIIKYDGQLCYDFKSETNIHKWDEFKDRGTKVCYSLKSEFENATI
jgi:hypothetical protein